MSNNLALPQLATAQQEKEATINDQSGGLDAALTEVVSVPIDDTNAATPTRRRQMARSPSRCRRSGAACWQCGTTPRRA